MQKHSTNGGHNKFDMVWEFKLSFQQFIDAKVRSWNYPWVWQPCKLQFAKGLLVFLYGSW
jgi:hypothetical protein